MTAALTGAPVGDAVTDCFDHAGDFVPRHGAGEQPHLVRGEIGAADAAAIDAHDHLSRNRLGIRKINELELMRVDETDGSHGYMSPSWATMRSNSEMTAGSV